jgi:hypothetical protein
VGGHAATAIADFGRYSPYLAMNWAFCTDQPFGGGMSCAVMSWAPVFGDDWWSGVGEISGSKIGGPTLLPTF